MRRRLPWLLGGLAVAAIALPASRIWLAGPPPPPPSASFDIQRRYWADRLRRDPSDIDAYVRLGTLEEKEGFYLSARRRLLEGRPTSRTQPPKGPPRAPPATV